MNYRNQITSMHILIKDIRNAGGPFVQHLSKLPGFKGRVYEEIDGTGIVELSDTLFMI